MKLCFSPGDRLPNAKDSQRDMAKITLRPEILAISGRVGNMVFRTQNGKTFVLSASRKKRTSPVSDKERASHSLFAQISQEVARRILNGDQRPRKEIWAEVKQSLS